MLKLLNVLGIVFLLLQSCKNDHAIANGNSKSNNVTEVEAYVATPTVIGNDIVTHGSVIANEEVELKNEVAGQVTGIYFEEGSFVKKGVLLVQMDDSELRPQLEKSKAELKLANEEFERKRQLFEIKGISKEELENSELQVATLTSDINLIKARINKLRIVAPFDGVVGLRSVSVGAYLNAGQRIAAFVQTNPVKLEFTVSETNASLIKKGIPVEFSLNGNGESLKAEVYAFDPAINKASRSLKVRAYAENESGKLIPGSFAELTVKLGAIDDGLLVPSIAITQDIRGQKVFVIEHGKAVAKEVETGIQQDDLVQVTKGIQAGDTIIITALLSMKEGMEVRVKQMEKE